MRNIIRAYNIFNRTGSFFNYWKHAVNKERLTGNTHYFAQNRSVMAVYWNACTIKNKRPILLYGGILTFLGLREETEPESELIMSIKKGIFYKQKGEFDKAEQMLHDALKLAHNEQNQEGVTYVYDVLANLALDTGQYKKAENLFLHVMQRLLNNGYEATHNKILHISLKMAKIFENMKEYEKAEIGYLYCVNNLQEKVSAISSENMADDDVKDTLLLWITTLDNYARYLANRHKLTEAMEYFQKAYNMSLQVNGKDHEDTALLLNDMASTLNSMGDVDSAVHYAEEAVGIAQDILGMDNLPVIYINLAYIYLAKDMYENARHTAKKALWIAKKDQYKEEYLNAAEECVAKIEEAFKNNEK